MTPIEALNRLKEGNVRFVNNLNIDRNLLKQVNATRDGQWPFAVVLSCIDSRTSAELIFDQGLGDIFSIRIAGNILNDDILGSMEFACKIAGSKCIVVLGHSKCGAVRGACDDLKMGHLTTLLSKLKPSVESECSEFELDSRNSSNSPFVEKVSIHNVKSVTASLIERSSILREMIENGEIAVFGAWYDLDSGNVQFL